MRRLIPLLLLAACATSPVVPDEHELRILVFNIFAGKDTTGAENLARVSALVRDEQADIVLLQEVDRGTRRSGSVDQPAVLEQGTGYASSFGKTLDYQGGEYGIALLSRWPVVRDSLIRLPVEPRQARSGGSYEPRGALLAVIQSPRGRIAVLNTHLDPSREDGYRLQEVATLLDAADSTRAEAPLVLLGGDLNARPDTDVIARVRARGWRDAWDGCGQGRGDTFPAHAPDRRIDYLFLSRGARCVEARTVGLGISDHLGILFILRVEGAGAAP